MPTEPLPLPSGDFRAYLFDLDGTVADTMPAHYVAWTRAVTARGGSFPEELFYSLGGVPPLKVVEHLNQRFGYTLDPHTLVEEKEAMFLQDVAQVRPIESVLAHILQRHGQIPLAIVSGSPRANVEQILRVLKLEDKFAAVVCAEDYTHGKPHPEPFLTGAKLLSVEPEHCLVFEDADAGIASAEAAGMQFVRVPAR